jgi:hypothetical protein
MGGEVVLSFAAVSWKSFRVAAMILMYESDLTYLRTSQGAGLSKQEGDLPNPLVMKFTPDLLRYRFDEQKMSVSWLCVGTGRCSSCPRAPRDERCRRINEEDRQRGREELGIVTHMSCVAA